MIITKKITERRSVRNRAVFIDKEELSLAFKGEIIKQTLTRLIRLPNIKKVFE